VKAAQKEFINYFWNRERTRVKPAARRGYSYLQRLELFERFERLEQLYP
jgi:hypothetical protein